ncbi:MAG: ABC transporter substrate-binding protein, partial [Rectinemataceae bacterium]
MKRPLPLILILLVLATIPVVAGFSAPAEKVTLRVMNYAQVEKAFVEINAAFMKKFPNIEVVYEPTPFDSYQEKFGAYIATKSGPDVMGNELSYLWDAADAFIPLNDKIKKEPAVFSDLIAYNMLYRYMDPKGPLLGLPMSYNGNVMYFNKDILREAGLNPDKPPQTWNDFAKACEAIK